MRARSSPARGGGPRAARWRGRHRGRSVVSIAALLLAALAAAAALAVPYALPYFIFRPTPLIPAEPAAWGLPEARAIAFSAPDRSRLTGWWIAPSSAEAPIVLLVHGRSANISTRAGIAKQLAADGFGILLFDYRGYGRSAGEPSESGIAEDTLAAYDWLRAQGVAPERIVVLGQSLGNAPAAALAATRPVGALVLVSPFISLPEAALDKWPWLPVGTLLWPINRFESGSRLAGYSGPLLLIASRGDGLVPIAHSRRVRGMAHGMTRCIEDRSAPHDGLLAKVAADGRLTRGLRILDLEIRYPGR